MSQTREELPPDKPPEMTPDQADVLAALTVFDAAVRESPHIGDQPGDGLLYVLHDLLRPRGVS